MAMMTYNPQEVKKTLSIIKPDGALYEVRLLESSGKGTYSGYFRDADTLISALRELEYTDDLSKYNIYVALNCVKESCYARDQRDRFIRNVKNQTSDADIAGYEYLFVDIDPKRPSGVSSTEEQLAKAKAVGNKVYTFMAQIGFSKPITAMSGNGVHLLYPVMLKNSSENRELVKTCLGVLDMLFSDEDVSIDKANFNPARICKLYGTLAHKGSDTKENPHRMSYMISDKRPESITHREYVDKLADMMPKQEKPQRYNQYNPREFDLDDWLFNHGIQYRKYDYSDGDKYILDCCPFDSNHNGKDAAIFKTRSGAIGFKCFHNSCADKTWRDVRVLYEPDAYEKRNEMQAKIAYKTHNRDNKPKDPVKIQTEEGKPLFYTAMDILNMPKKEETFIRTGVSEADRKIRGLKKSYVSLWSGLRASGKSSVLSNIIATAREDGNNIGVYSGELSERNFMRWLVQQIAGRNRVEQGKFEGYYNVPKKYQEKIAAWLGDHFWLYNNEYGNRFDLICDEFEQKIEENKLDFLVLDNLMSFNISNLADTKWDAQTEFVWRLHGLANKHNVHIAFVAHPRKAQGFLRLDDISGSADIANAVEYAFIVHRNNNDFKRLSKQMFGWKDDNYIYEGTNIIEVAKDRDGGTQDLFIPLYFEKETRRLKNSRSENIIYGWDDEDFVPAGADDIAFDIDFD